MIAQLTPWFPADIKPQNEGWYEVRRKSYGKELREKYIFHNGKWWITLWRKKPLMNQKLEWRGILKAKGK